MSTDPEPKGSRGAIPLILAWLVLIGAVGVTVAIVTGDQPSAPVAEPLASITLPQAASEQAVTEPSPEAAPPEAPPPEPLEEVATVVPDEAPLAEPGPQMGAAPEADAAPTTETDPDIEAGLDPAEPAAIAPGDEAAPAVEETGSLPGPPPVPTMEQTASEVPGDAGETQVAALPLPDLPPWQRYGARFDSDDTRPQVAVVVTGLGLAAAATEAAIKQLPAAVTLSFSPYARRLEQWIPLARARGHEVMLDLPMEPETFPDDDPGPQALLTALENGENLERLDWVLRRAGSVVGVAGAMGSRFTAAEDSLRPVLEELKDRGYMILDNHATEESAIARLAQGLDLPHVVNDRAVDAVLASRVAIDARLTEVERLARENGFAVAMAQPYPVTLERLRSWASALEKRGIALVPITALAQRRSGGE